MIFCKSLRLLCICIWASYLLAILLIICYIDKLICNLNKSIVFLINITFPWFVSIRKSFLLVNNATKIQQSMLVNKFRSWLILLITVNTYLLCVFIRYINKNHENIFTERHVPYKFALDAYFQFRCKLVWLIYRRLCFIKIQFNLIAIRNTHANDICIFLFLFL